MKVNLAILVYFIGVLLSPPVSATLLLTNTGISGAGCVAVDGCAGAPAVSPSQLAAQIAGGYMVKHSDFFTGYAAQSIGERTSSQPVTGVYPARPSWNVAGVDYAVGIPAASVLAGLKVPVVGDSRLPPHCTASIIGYGTTVTGVNCQSDLGATFAGTISGCTTSTCILTVTLVRSVPATPSQTPLVVNSIVTDAATGNTAKITALGTGTGGLGTYIINNPSMSAGPEFTIGGITFDGWDFSNIYLSFTYNISGPIVIKNSKFAYGSNFAEMGVWSGTVFTGSVSGNQLTVTSISYGKIILNTKVSDSAGFVATGTVANGVLNVTSINSSSLAVGAVISIGSYTSGTALHILSLGVGTTGGVGTYNVDNVNASVPTPTSFYAAGYGYSNLSSQVSGPTGGVGVYNLSSVGMTNGPNYSIGGTTGLAMVSTGPSLIFKNNYVDSNGTQSSLDNSNQEIFLYTGHFPQQYYYNVFLRARARFISTVNYAQQGDFTLKYNYIEGLAYKSGDAHGEVTLLTFSGTMNSYVAQYNTWLEPKTSFMDLLICDGQPCTNGATGVIVPSLSTQTPPPILTNFVLDHEVHVGNFSFVGGAYVDKVTVSSGGAEFQMANYINVTLTNNWIDPTGTWYCFNTPGDIGPITNLTMGGNINLLTGNPANGLAGSYGTASLSGGILTVATSTVGGIGVGSTVVLLPSQTSATVLSRGTGTGGAGTYHVDNTTGVVGVSSFAVYGDQCNGHGTFYSH